MFRSHSLRRLLPIIGLALALALTGCGSPDKDTDKETGAKLPTGLALKVIKEGDGAVVADGDSVTVDYQGTNATSGDVFDQSYGKTPATFATSGVVPGFGAALVGQKVGSQILVSIPPEFGYGETGSEGAGIKGTDTIVFVIEIKEAKGAELNCDFKPGAASKAVKVTGAFSKAAKPTFTKPLKSAAIQRTILTAGKGAEPKAGDEVDVLLSIYNGRTGKKLSAEQGKLKAGDPATGDAFGAGISCVKVGSRVVTTVPAKVVVGDAGNPQAGIKATDTLVFVTDVISTAAAAAGSSLPKTEEWKDAPEVTFNGSEPPSVKLPE